MGAGSLIYFLLKLAVPDLCQKTASGGLLGFALPSFAEGHGCKPVDECEVGTLRSLGEGGCASEGSARRRVWRGATAVRPWGSTLDQQSRCRFPCNEATEFCDAPFRAAKCFPRHPWAAT